MSVQLFRRVAAALPGMETTQERPKDDRILTYKIVPILMWSLTILQLLRSDCRTQRQMKKLRAVIVGVNFKLAIHALVQSSSESYKLWWI